MTRSTSANCTLEVKVHWVPILLKKQQEMTVTQILGQLPIHLGMVKNAFWDGGSKLVWRPVWIHFQTQHQDNYPPHFFQLCFSPARTGMASTCSFNTARQRLMMWKQKQSVLNNCSASMSDVWKRIWHLKVMSAVPLLSTWIWDFMLTAVKGDWLSYSLWRATIFYKGKSFVRQEGVRGEEKKIIAQFYFHHMIFRPTYRQNTLSTEHAVVLLLFFFSLLRK